MIVNTHIFFWPDIPCIWLGCTHLQLGRLKQLGQRVLLKDTRHGVGLNSQPCVYKASTLTITPRLPFSQSKEKLPSLTSEDMPKFLSWILTRKSTRIISLPRQSGTSNTVLSIYLIRHVNSTAFGGSLPLFECIFRLPLRCPDLPLFVQSPSFQSLGVVHTFRLRIGHCLSPL